jgi:hypothetical protein
MRLPMYICSIELEKRDTNGRIIGTASMSFGSDFYELLEKEAVKYIDQAFYVLKDPNDDEVKGGTCQTTKTS